MVYMSFVAADAEVARRRRVLSATRLHNAITLPAGEFPHGVTFVLCYLTVTHIDPAADCQTIV